MLENELKKVFSIEKGFQPILPDSFCLKNLKELSANYGFPSASVCVAFYRNYISKLQTITEYSCVFQEINDAIQTKEGNSQEHQGVFLHQLEQKELDSLQKLLEEQYLATILANLKKSLSLISGNKINGDQKVNELISKNNKKYIVKLGHFVDNYKSIKENIRNNSECFNIGNLVGSYYELLASDRKNLNVLMKNITCEYVLYIAQNGMKDKVFMLYHALQDYSQWISSQIISQIKELVNIEFSKLSKLDELEYAYKGNFISVEQYLEQYKLLTCNYELKQLYEIIQNNYGESLPLFIQEYLIKEIVEKSDFECLSPQIYKFHSPGRIVDFIEWLNLQSLYNRLNKGLVNSTIVEIVNALDKEGRWYLFEKEVIDSPLADNIREHLDEAYCEHNLKNRFFQKDCFQAAMVEDVLGTTEVWKVFLIIPSLNNKYKAQIIDRGNDFLRFCLWASEPDEIVNWNLLGQYFSLLPVKMQVNLFRYLFYLKACNKVDFSMTNLYGILTQPGKLACSTLQVICFILNKKLDSLSAVIRKDEIKGVWEGGVLQDFFYECTGPLKLSIEELDIKNYESYGNIRKEQIDGINYFVISFYDYPINYYGFEVGNEFDMEYIDYIKSVLEQNFLYKKIDGEYWISEQFEFDVRTFVISYHIMDDKCNLFNDDVENSMGEPIPLLMHWNVKYKEDRICLCKCGRCQDVDPQYGIPFYWCRKNVCTRRGRFLVPISEWKQYKFVDLLNILYNNNILLREKILDVNAEISQLLIDYIEHYEDSKIKSHPIDYEEDRGVWTDGMSIMADIYPDVSDMEDYGYNEYCDDTYYDDDGSTYGRYAGSYAQDEMGYSDEDIDIIFDGEPDAYWNID